MFCYVLLWFAIGQLYQYSSGLHHSHWEESYDYPRGSKVILKNISKRAPQLTRNDKINKAK